jgi:beta-phosphoglucomutase-like phosphatase (HAD superfamily)
MSTPIKAVLFDLDGTLVDTEGLSDEAMYMALDGVLPEAVKKDLTKSNRLPWDLKRAILGKRGAEWAPIVIDHAGRHWGVDMQQDPLPDVLTVAGLWSRWEDCLSSLCPQVKACRGSVDLVKELARAKIPMGIATSSREAAVQQKRVKHEATIFQHMSIVVCGDHPEVRHGKPAPDIYLVAARDLGYKPEECLVFEDALTGVQAAKAAGCRVVAVPDARSSEEDLQAYRDLADQVLGSLEDFEGAQFGLSVNIRKRETELVE